MDLPKRDYDLAGQRTPYLGKRVLGFGRELMCHGRGAPLVVYGFSQQAKELFDAVGQIEEGCKHEKKAEVESFYRSVGPHRL